MMYKIIKIFIMTLLFSSNVYSQDIDKHLYYIGSVENIVSIDIEKSKSECLKSSICNEDTHLENLLQVNTMFKKMPISSSTGFFVRLKDEQRVITTSHSIKEKSSVYDEYSSVFKNIFPLPVSIKIKQYFKTKYMTYELTKKRCSKKRDLCSLKVKFPTGIGFDLQECSLKVGDKVTIIGNPKGIFYKTNNFFISFGIFIGYDKDNDINLNAKIHLGSSGSPILSDNKVCGVIKGYSKAIRELAYGSSLSDIISLFN